MILAGSIQVKTLAKVAHAYRYLVASKSDTLVDTNINHIIIYKTRS